MVTGVESFQGQGTSQGQLFPRRLGWQERGGNVTFPSEPGRWWLKKEPSAETADSPDLCTHLRDCELPLPARDDGEGNGSRETFFISLIRLRVCNHVQIHEDSRGEWSPRHRCH